MAEDNHETSSGTQRAMIGAGVAVAAGAVAFMIARKATELRDDGETISEAPDHVFRRGREHDGALVGRTVTIGRPKQELYERWRDFTRFPEFMENVQSVEMLGDGRSRWTIAAPAGSTVELVTRITDDRPGECIAWASEPESGIDTEGQVEFGDSAPGRGTSVRLTMRYTPPGGLIGRGIAKLMQREPNIQARRDLRRFKQLMETGEVTSNASPSGRDSESPTQSRI